MTSNPFTAFGETLAPTKKPRQDKEQQDRECLSQEYQRWRKQAIDALLNGPLSTAARALLDFLDRMQPCARPRSSRPRTR